MTKPEAEIIGKDGNVYNLISICQRALKKDGQPEKADEMFKRIEDEAQNYDHALRIMMEYVSPT
jgi:hypothetical protein